MKTIYIDPETWGPDSLYDPYIIHGVDAEGEPIRGTAICCLGFACLQLGAAAKDVECLALPSSLRGKAIIETNDDLVEFIRQGQQRASQKLITAAEAMLRLFDPASNPITNLSRENIIATINDSYHALSEPLKTKLLDPTLKVLQLGFKEMGYELVYGRPADG